MIFITQGRYTREAMAGMLVRPEDRAVATKKLVQKVGGKIIDYYFTFGEYDFLIIVDAPDVHAWTTALVAAAASGGVTDLKTTIAMTTAEAKKAFSEAGEVSAVYKPAGAK